jgi:HEAT repeat protein
MTTGQPSVPAFAHQHAGQADPVLVEEVLRALGAALRSYRLYEGSNPMVDRFVAVLREKMTALWTHLPYLRLQIEEHRIRWEDRPVYPIGDSGKELPFLFYTDGIRELTFLPGFEEAELMSLLGVLARAPAVREEEDDLITLLWQEELTRLRYRAVEASLDGVELESGTSSGPSAIDPEAVRSEPAMPQAVSTEDFEESLYFLDESELRRLREEVRRESDRDLWRDVLNALLDRLEDGEPDRQSRIVGIMAELLPATLANAQFERAMALLEELIALGMKPGALAPATLRETRILFQVLAREETIFQMAELLEEAPERLNDSAVPRLLGYFPPAAIVPLLRAVERSERISTRQVLESCIQRIGEANRDQLVELLRDPDPAVVRVALQWIARIGIGSAVNEVVKFLRHPEASLRAAAVEALASLNAAAAGNAIVPLLQDEEREVRVAAARALGEFAFGPAREALEAALASRTLREADRTEKLAFFEAFGRLAGVEGVPALNRFLNSRSWIGRGESTEVRACAALALARIRHPSAREALLAAANDRDPVVRSAVARAMRGEAG